MDYYSDSTPVWYGMYLCRPKLLCFQSAEGPTRGLGLKAVNDVDGVARLLYCTPTHRTARMCLAGGGLLPDT